MYRRLIPLMFLLAGCQESTFFVPKDDPDAPQPASIQGRVCDPSGRTWLADALVYTHLRDADGEIYDTRVTYSDRDGFWLLDDLPPNYDWSFGYDVFVYSGMDPIETYEDIFLANDEVLVLPEPDCFDPLQVDVAIITGDYDDFQLVLANMGFANYILVDGLTRSDIFDFLADPANLEPYDIIFFNGGHIEEDVIYDLDGSDEAGDVDLVHANIQAYVEAGGTIYASDWAYDVIEQIWPDRINWVGDDTIPDDAQRGEYGFLTAAVQDSALASFLGTDYVDIEFDLPVWPVLENVDASVSTHLVASVSYRDGTASYTLPLAPILVSFTAGEGKVVYAAFRVAKNATDDMVMTLQYMMYNL